MINQYLFHQGTWEKINYDNMHAISTFQISVIINQRLINKAVHIFHISLFWVKETLIYCDGNFFCEYFSFIFVILQRNVKRSYSFWSNFAEEFDAALRLSIWRFT